MIDYFKLFPLLIGKCKWLRGCLCTMQCALLDRVTWNTWHIKKIIYFFTLGLQDMKAIKTLLDICRVYARAYAVHILKCIF